MSTEKNNQKRNVKTAEAVSVYNALKGLKIAKLAKGDQFAAIRAARALKPVAVAFEDFVKDARERLKPEGFDAVVEMSQRFDSLSDDEKRDVNAKAMAYQKDVDECVKTELEREVEVDPFEALSEDALSGIASENEGLTVETLMLIGDVCG